MVLNLIFKISIKKSARNEQERSDQKITTKNKDL